LKEAGHELANNREENMVKKRAAKRATKKSVKKGDVYKCSVCGLAIKVDEVCGCVDTCDIICCEKPMRVQKCA
jgi:rubrerythrin